MEKKVWKKNGEKNLKKIRKINLEKNMKKKIEKI